MSLTLEQALIPHERQRPIRLSHSVPIIYIPTAEHSNQSSLIFYFVASTDVMSSDLSTPRWSVESNLKILFGALSGFANMALQKNT